MMTRNYDAYRWQSQGGARAQRSVRCCGFFGAVWLGLPAFTFELGTTFFEACSAFENTIYPDNLEALLYAAKVVRAPLTIPSGPEFVWRTLSPNVVAPATPVVASASVDDDRYGPGETIPAAPVHNIAAATVYVDVPPWEALASPIAMTAVDGAFDDSVESVTATVDTTGLADGRHLVYFQAQDGAGNWGSVSAAFLWIMDPAAAAHIAGSVNDSSSGSPLAANITAGLFNTVTDAGDGSYDLMLPSGVYDLTATAPGYWPETVNGVVATVGSTMVQDFQLVAYPSSLADNVESGNLGWTAEASWAITDEASSSPTHSWTDSPGGYYGHDQSSLISPVIDLSAAGDVVLEFRHIYDITAGDDHGHVEYSVDGGLTWASAASYSGTELGWQTVTLPLGELDGVANARIRFRLSPNGMITKDGWHIDDIFLAGTQPAIFSDYFESGDTAAWSATVQ